MKTFPRVAALVIRNRARGFALSYCAQNGAHFYGGAYAVERY